MSREEKIAKLKKQLGGIETTKTVSGKARDTGTRDTESIARNVRDTVEVVGKTARTIKAAFNMAAKTWDMVKPILGPLPRWGAQFYDFAAYKSMPDGTRVFSPNRSAFAAVALGAAVWFGGPMAMHGAFNTVAGVAEFAWDGAVYGLTKHEEVGRFQTPVLIDPATRTFRVSVCDLGTTCSPNDVTTYLIRDSYFFDAMEWMKLRPSYYPDYVQGAVTAPGMVCKYTSWGLENFKFMRRYFSEAKIYNIQCDNATAAPATAQSVTPITAPALPVAAPAAP